jgi:hypothetical protein
MNQDGIVCAAKYLVWLRNGVIGDAGHRSLSSRDMENSSPTVLAQAKDNDDIGGQCAKCRAGSRSCSISNQRPTAPNLDRRTGNPVGRPKKRDGRITDET